MCTQTTRHRHRTDGLIRGNFVAGFESSESDFAQRTERVQERALSHQRRLLDCADCGSVSHTES